VKLLIAGAGGHGRVAADAALASHRFSQVAFLDDGYPAVVTAEGWPVIGGLDSLQRCHGEFTMFFPAFGDAKLRLNELARATSVGYDCPAIIHPTATVSNHATVGPGSIVCAGAVVATGATIGLGCIVNTGATVDHDCRIDDGVHICPGAHLAGNVQIGCRTWFGIGAVAIQGVSIGESSTIGAGAVVVADVPGAVTYVGIPARELAR
jgi:sugar O-acyltransferase (sialic acid O-acetyltransferase NeuD family)